MKKRNLILLVALLLAAAVLGWLLPPAVFLVEDHLEKEKRETLEIRQFDLSYQSDLDVSARLQLIRGNSAATSVSLDRGIYLQAKDVKEISERFLGDLSGYRLSLMDRCELLPTLFSYPGDGTFIVWIVRAPFNGVWSWEAMIDDQTGLILRFAFYGNSWNPESLFLDLDGALDESSIIARISEALTRHYRERLSEDLSANVSQTVSSGAEYSAVITFSEGDAQNHKYTVPLQLFFDVGVIVVN